MKFHLYFARKKKSCKEQTDASQMEVVSETIHFGIVYGTKRLSCFFMIDVCTLIKKKSYFA
jgi:hypothetical protein